MLTEGHYQLLVHDLADIHNFVLGSKTTGERLATTEIPFVGDQTFDITLAPGQYVYACSPHFETMFGRLQVVAAQVTPTPPGEAVGEGDPERRLDQRQERRRRRLQADRRRPFAHAELPPRRAGSGPPDEQEVHRQRDLARSISRPASTGSAATRA